MNQASLFPENEKPRCPIHSSPLPCMHCSQGHSPVGSPTPPKWWADRNQIEEHLRVWCGLAHIIWAFCCERSTKDEWHMEDLRAWCCARAGAAPASPDRILRSLRQEGLIEYTVVSRSKSRYRIDSVKR